jgi:hypothetical protein
VILLQSFSGQMLFAQSDNLNLTLFGISTIPTNHFAENLGKDPRITRRFGFDYGKNAGLAANGFGAGMQTSQQVLVTNLNWIISVKFLTNSVDNSRITELFNEQVEDSVNISFENGNWMNIPIFTGFSYDFFLSNTISLYASLQGGLNITKQPYRRAIVDGEVVEQTTFRTTPDFGFEAGIGCKIVNKYTIGVGYLNLSSPRYEGTRELDESFFKSIPKRVMNVDGDERPVSILVFYFGYTL